MTQIGLDRLLALFMLVGQAGCAFGDRAGDRSNFAVLSPDARASVQQLRLTQIQHALPRDYPGLVPLLDPEHGRFPYWYINTNQIFNQYTYEYVSTRVEPGPVPGTVQLSGANGFTDATIQLLSAIGYSLGTRDRTTLQALQQRLAMQELALVAVYEQVFGPITDAQMQAANAALRDFETVISTKLDYVVLYIIGYLWSGHDESSKPPLTFTQMADAKSLDALFPELPGSGAVVLPALVLVLDSHRCAHVVAASLQYNSWALAEVLRNAQDPNQTNGGIRTFNPLDGMVTDYQQVAYGIGISLAEIRNGLMASDRVITLEFDFYGSEPDRSRATPLSLGDLVTVGDPGGRPIGLPGRARGSNGTVHVRYEGYVYVPFTRGDWSPNTNHGWYYADPISQAAAASDRTGYAFYVDPPYELGAGGDFGLLTGVFITNSPTVTIRYGDVDELELEVFAEQTARGTVRLSGEIMHGTSRDRLYDSEIVDDPRSRRRSIVFTPSEAHGTTGDVTVPEAMQMADVLLVSVSYPGARTTVP